MSLLPKENENFHTFTSNIFITFCHHYLKINERISARDAPSGVERMKQENV